MYSQRMIDMDLRKSTDTSIIKSVRIVNFLYGKTGGASIDCQLLMTVLLALTSFSLTVSISLKSLFIFFTGIAILFCRRREILKVLTTPWFIAAMLFFLIIVIGCFISPADRHSQLSFVHKYSKLFYLPILALGFQNKESRFWAIHAFLFGMLFTLGCSELKVFGLIKMKGAQYDFGHVFYNHIVTGYYMAFAAFLAAVYATRTQGKLRVAYILMGLLFSYHTLFVNSGRTGYVMFAVLFLIFLTGSIRRLFSWVFILILASLLAYQSPVVQRGVGNIVRDIQNYQQGQLNSSVGYRMQFHSFAQRLFFTSPLLGVGTGGFSHYYGLDKPVPAWNRALMEPHGEYWLIGAEHGLVGLLIFLFFIVTLFYETFRLNEMRLIFLGLLITFLVGCCTDGILLLTGPGYFFVIFAAMGLGESIRYVPLDDSKTKSWNIVPSRL